MGRKKVFTNDYYTEAAKSAANRMKHDGSYSKDQVLKFAGFDEGQKQHWPKLRRGFAKNGITVCWTNEGQWHKGANGQTGNVIELYSSLSKRLALGFRTEVIAASQRGSDANDTVAGLMNKGYDPVMCLTAMRHAGQPLPEEVEAGLVRAVQLVLPEAPLDVRTQIETSMKAFTDIAGLLSAPAGG